MIQPGRSNRGGFRRNTLLSCRLVPSVSFVFSHVSPLVFLFLDSCLRLFSFTSGATAECPGAQGCAEERFGFGAAYAAQQRFGFKRPGSRTGELRTAWLSLNSSLVPARDPKPTTRLVLNSASAFGVHALPLWRPRGLVNSALVFCCAFLC